LAKGSVLQCVDPRHRVGAVYSTSVGNVGVFVTGTRFEVDLTPTGHVDVTTVEGNVNVQVGAQHAQVASGQHIDIDPSPDRGASPQAADEAVLEKFNGQADLLAEGGLVQQADAALGVFEDQVVLRLLDDMSFLRKHDPVETAWKDTRSILTAQVAMKSICSMLQASANGDLPATIDLQTLEPLDLPAKDVKRILSGFEGHQLQSYQLLSHDHYTFTARVANSAHTLLRATDGVVETVAEHTTSNAIAPRSQSTDASDQ